MIFKPMTFEEWKRANPEAVNEAKDTACAECEGTGLVECYHCGQDMDCRWCKGSGMVDPETVMQKMYKDQVKRDEERLKTYLENAGVTQ